MTSVLSPEAVAAICRHLDEDHAEDGLLLCRTLGGRPDAVSARTVDVDPAGLRFAVTGPDGTVEEVVVPFAAPVQERAQVRAAVVALHARAVAEAGLPPRSH